MPEKEELRQFADFRVRLVTKVGVVFLKGIDTPMYSM